MKDKSKLIERHIKEYLNSKVEVESAMHTHFVRPHSLDFFRFVENAFNQLDEDSKLIIENDFVKKKEGTGI